jgi:hypothetical protein
MALRRLSNVSSPIPSSSGQALPWIDYSHLSPTRATQAQWDELIQRLHASGKTLRISRETFHYLLQAHPVARPIAPGLWVRDGEGPVMEFTSRCVEDQWIYTARIYSAP